LTEKLSQKASYQEASVYDSCWYQALSLSERFASLQAAKKDQIPTDFDKNLARRRVYEYESGKENTHSSQLKRGGYAEEDVLHVFGETADAVQAHTQVPDWLERLVSVLQNAKDAPEHSFLDTSSNRFSLLSSVDIFTHAYYHQLRQAITKLAEEYVSVPFHAETIAPSFLSHLVSPLVSILSRTMVLELNVARLQNQLQGETSEERFQDFIRQIRQKKRLTSLLEEYPVLARQVENVYMRWQTYSLEFLRHLCNDWGQICTYFTPECPPGELVEILGDAGDTHRGGRSVLQLKFSSGFRLFYKPKSLAIDRHFQELLTWLNEQGFQPAFRTMKVLDRLVYGWCEYIEAQECQEPAEVTRFYERQGGYLALLYALNATDFHYENLIAAGQYPILIDYESLFHPTAVLNEERQDGAFDAINTSVVRVGMLPNRISGNDVNLGMDISGLGGRGGQQTPRPVLSWEKAGTDRMHISRKHMVMGAQQNRPSLRGAEIDLLEYCDSLERGFTRMYRLLLDIREVCIAEPLAHFIHDTVRCILRPTAVYADILTESFHPDLLRDALDRDSHFDYLWLAAQHVPALARVIEAERRDLLAGDIPLFTTYPDSRDLYTSQDEIIRDYFETISFDTVRHTLYQLDENDLKRQLWFIQTSLASTFLGKTASTWKRSSVTVPTGKALTRERLLAAACAVGDRLCELALHDRQGANWVGLALVGDRQWLIAPTSLDLYNGNAGILLFLAYLGAITGKETYTKAAKAAYVTFRRQLTLYQESLKHVGGFEGWGSVIYLLTHLGVIWGDTTLLSDAEAFVQLLPPVIEQDNNFDVLTGMAGGILSLASLYHVDPSPTTLEVAVQCGERLLMMAHEESTGRAWHGRIPEIAPLAGFSHGVAGCVLSLLVLADISGDQRFYTLAQDALKYERGLFSVVEQNWPDLRMPEGEIQKPDRAELPYMVSWCHGAPGIGLGRLAGLRYMDDACVRAEIRSAMETTIKHGFGFNHSLCHGDGGNLDVVLLASQMLPDPQYRSELEHFGSLLLDSIEVDGWLPGIPLSIETPGFMTGLAGIGYELLRLAAPEHVPSVLVLAPPLKNDRAV